MRAFTGRIVSMVVTRVVILVLLSIVLGATGWSVKIVGASVNEELRMIQQSLARTIRDPEELAQAIEAKRQELYSLYGLDRPWYHRIPQAVLRAALYRWSEAKILRSFSGSARIIDIVLERLPNTVLMMTTSFVIVAMASIPLGVWAATHAGSRLDRWISTFSTISFAMPSWWLAVIFIMVFAVKLGIFPTGGMYSAPPPEGSLLRFLDLLWHAVLPVTTLVLVSLGPSAYVIRSIALKVAQGPFVLYAQASGFSEQRVRWRHVLRAAAPPIVTGLALGLVSSFGGAILTETVFNWPGMGRLYWDAFSGTPDEGIIVALTVLSMDLFLVARFFLDYLYVWLDPTIRYDARGGAR